MSDENQMLRERIADHLIDRDDYFNLDIDQLEEFLEWATAHASDFMDGYTSDDRWVQDFDIDGLFNKWMGAQLKEAA